MKKILILFVSILTALVVILGMSYGAFQLSKSRTFQFFGGLTHRLETSEKVIALTFDDGPTQYTEDILQILTDTNTPSTWYVIGENVEQYPEKIQKVVAAGHELGNHTYSHKRMLLKSPFFIAREIEQTDHRIRNAGYEGEITFRPPNGKKLFGLPLYLWQTNRKTIMWDVEPESYTDIAGNTERIVNHVIQHTHPGSIILLHPFNQHAATREALPTIIQKLKNQGYTFVTVSELLKKQSSQDSFPG